MRRRHDHGHAARDMLQHCIHHLLALGIAEHELLGIIGENADALRAGIDHEVDAAPLAVEIELAAVIEDGGRNGKDAAIRPCGSRSHENYLRWLYTSMQTAPSNTRPLITCW